MTVKPDILDDRSWRQPDGHQWTRSEQEWVELRGAIPCYVTRLNAEDEG